MFASMENKIETRGAKAKYDYDSIAIGDYIEVDISAGGILSSAKGWAMRNKKKHKFYVRTVDKIVRLYRSK